MTTGYACGKCGTELVPGRLAGEYRCPGIKKRCGMLEYSAKTLKSLPMGTYQAVPMAASTPTPQTSRPLPLFPWTLDGHLLEPRTKPGITPTYLFCKCGTRVNYAAAKHQAVNGITSGVISPCLLKPTPPTAPAPYPSPLWTSHECGVCGRELMFGSNHYSGNAVMHCRPGCNGYDALTLKSFNGQHVAKRVHSTIGDPHQWDQQTECPDCGADWADVVQGRVSPVCVKTSPLNIAGPTTTPPPFPWVIDGHAFVQDFNIMGNVSCACGMSISESTAEQAVLTGATKGIVPPCANSVTVGGVTFTTNTTAPPNTQQIAQAMQAITQHNAARKRAMAAGLYYDLDEEQNTADITPPKDECAACGVELCDYFDAYYGTDARLKSMCSKCRKEEEAA